MRWLQLKRTVPSYSWSIFHPSVRFRALQPVEKLQVTVSPHLHFIQTHVQPSKFQTNLMRWGALLGVTSALYQFLTNLHTVPITGRTQVVVLSREEECEMGNKTSLEVLSGQGILTEGPRRRMCIDVASRLVSVSEHLFPREYDWRVWVVDNPNSPNACCCPGGKIIVQTGILDMIDYAVEKGYCKNKHDALAVVLAHEIGHALARHTAESMSYLPLIYLQIILGMESPLLQYLFQFAMNLPFSRKQEAEADHIGIMLLASACYDPTEAPRLWRAFSAFINEKTNDSNAQEGDGDDDIDFDFFSTHPSNKKRERALEALVEDALELQRKSSWCFSLKEKVQQLMLQKPENELLHRILMFRAHQQEETDAVRAQMGRRPTLGTIHEMENNEVFKVIRDENEKRQQASPESNEQK